MARGYTRNGCVCMRRVMSVFCVMDVSSTRVVAVFGRCDQLWHAHPDCLKFSSANLSEGRRENTAIGSLQPLVPSYSQSIDSDTQVRRATAIAQATMLKTIVLVHSGRYSVRCAVLSSMNRVLLRKRGL